MCSWMFPRASWAPDTNHLLSLSEDTPLRSADQSKLKGYYNKSIDAKYLFLLSSVTLYCPVKSNADWSP